VDVLPIWSEKDINLIICRYFCSKEKEAKSFFVFRNRKEKDKELKQVVLSPGLEPRQ
jgi:hypothetical protein